MINILDHYRICAFDIQKKWSLDQVLLELYFQFETTGKLLYSKTRF